MKKVYVQPSVKVITILHKGLLCASGNVYDVKPEIKKYGCPIKDGIDCPDYDKEMYEYEQWLKDLANRQSSAIFNQGLDEYHCPRKSCPIYLEWQKQQKTR